MVSQNHSSRDDEIAVQSLGGPSVSLGDDRLSLTLETTGSLQVAENSSDKPLLHFLHIAWTLLWYCMHARWFCIFCSVFFVQFSEVVLRHLCQLDYDRKGVQSSFQLLSKALPFAVHSDMIQLCVCVCVCVLGDSRILKTPLKPL